MKDFFVILLSIGVVVFLFCFIRWCIALIKTIRSKYDLEATEKLLYWNLGIVSCALYLKVINILAKIFS